MKYLSRQIVFREIPEHVSLSYLITGCTLRCPGCHSSDSWNAERGNELTLDVLAQHLDKYRDWISCVLFMGGEWESEQLIEMCRLAHARGLKTALYTGNEHVSASLIEHLDFLKTGPYVASLGGLDKPTSNQKLIEVKTGRNLNFYFLNASHKLDSVL